MVVSPSAPKVVLNDAPPSAPPTTTEAALSADAAYSSGVAPIGQARRRAELARQGPVFFSRSAGRDNFLRGEFLRGPADQAISSVSFSE